MSRRLLLLALAALATPLAAQDPQPPPTGVKLGLIYQTAARPKLAVRPFGGGAGLESSAGQIHGIVARDLDYSDRFQLAEVPQQLASGPVDYRPWDELGLVFLLTGDVEAQAGGYSLRLVLHDIPFGTVKEIRAFTLPAANAPQFRLAVHAAADEVVRWATGQPGMAASRIAVVRVSRSGGYELMLVDSDGENLRRAAGSEQILLSPTWAPDGKRLAYAVQTPEFKWQILERELETGAVRVVSARGALNLTPAYAADGRRLAFASQGGSVTELYDYNIADRCCLRRLARASRDDMSPSYSPDGRQLAFMSNRLGQPHIYAMPAEGGNAVVLSPYVYGEPGYYTSPDWSPTGSLVAFHGRSRGEHQIMVADAARPGATVQQLTTEGENEDPSWAPDGRHVVFTSTRGAGTGVYVLDTVTGRLRPLVIGGRFKTPDWSATLLAAAALAARER